MTSLSTLSDASSLATHPPRIRRSITVRTETPAPMDLGPATLVQTRTESTRVAPPGPAELVLESARLIQMLVAVAPQIDPEAERVVDALVARHAPKAGPKILLTKRT